VNASRQRHFEAVVSEATPAVAAFLSRRLYPLAKADLDDLVEEVLIVAWRRLDDIPAGAETAWMIGVARNVLRNAVRKHHNGKRATDQVRPSGASASAEEAVVADEGVRSALAALSDDDRDILMLHFWDGIDTPDIAMLLGISPNAAAVRVTRAQDRFRRFLELTASA